MEIFLATTSLEDFWDTSKPILFLGEGCKLYSRRAFWEKLDYRDLQNLWKDPRDVLSAFITVKALLKKLLPRLAKAFNAIHGVEHSERYWRILLIPWMEIYFSAVYDRYSSLKKALELYPDLTTIGLDEGSFIVPRDATHYNNLINDDPYNLQIGTKIFQFLGKEFPRKKLEIIENPCVSFQPSSSLLRKGIKKIGKDCFKKAGRFFRNDRSIVLKSAYFSHSDSLQLLLRTGGLVWPDLSELSELPGRSTNKETRLRLRDLFSEESEFERLLKEILPFDMPQSYLEGYSHLTQEVKKVFPKKPMAIMSANLWQFNDPFKLWAASMAEKGALLVGTQHGGNYGSALAHPNIDHELSIVDRYYSWGWERPNAPCEIVPFFASKLIRNKKSGNQGHGVVFVTAPLFRFTSTFPLIITNNFPDYLSWQHRFIKSLSPKVRGETRVRLPGIDCEWDLVNRWKDLHEDLEIEDWNISFRDSLNKSRLYVSDHLSTTFIESLAIEKPTILFWDFDFNPLLPEAQPFYDALCSVGILHSSPESAGRHLVQVFDDVESWWNDPECRRVRKEFCHQFARTSPTAVQKWADEFKKIAKKREIIGGARNEEAA